MQLSLRALPRARPAASATSAASFGYFRPPPARPPPPTLIKAWLPAPPRPGSAPHRLRAREVPLSPQGPKERVGYFRTVEETVRSGDYGCSRNTRSEGFADSSR